MIFPLETLYELCGTPYDATRSWLVSVGQWSITREQLVLQKSNYNNSVSGNVNFSGSYVN